MKGIAIFLTVRLPGVNLCTRKAGCFTKAKKAPHSPKLFAAGFPALEEAHER